MKSTATKRSLTQIILTALCLSYAGASLAVCSAGIVLESVAEATPSNDFIDLQNGTVAHLKTGLIWKRCAEGQSWSGNSCDGEPIRGNWSTALQLAAQSSFAGSTDWRVPNRKELESIVEFCGHSPAINQFQFPPTPSERFWSSTSFVESPSSAWDVYFSDGYSGLSNKDQAANAVRLVRSAPPGSLLKQQELSFGVLPSVSIGQSATLGVASTGGLPVSLGSQTAAICSVSGLTVQGIAEGFCTVRASQAGNAEYYPAPDISATFFIGKVPQTITFGTLPVLKVGSNGTLNATATSGLAVSLSSGTPEICTLSGAQVSGLAAGTCTLTANQPGNSVYAAAVPTSVSIVVGNLPTADNSGNVPPGIKIAMNLKAGWHLLGNGLTKSIIVSERFGLPGKVESVWKWDPLTRSWGFFSPALTGRALQNYLNTKGFQPLTEIKAGEAYWLRLKGAHDFGVMEGNPIVLNSAMLLPGWNLVTIGEAMTPSELNAALATTPVPAGNVAQSFISLWAWDAQKGRWLFYSPALEGEGGGRLKAHNDSKGFLDFVSEQKKIGAGTGFWIRK